MSFPTQPSSAEAFGSRMISYSPGALGGGKRKRLRCAGWGLSFKENQIPVRSQQGEPQPGRDMMIQARGVVVGLFRVNSIFSPEGIFHWRGEKLSS